MMKLGRLILATIVSLFILFSICPTTIQADDGEESDNSTATVNLTVTVLPSPSPPSGGGGGEPSQPPVKTDIFGEKGSLQINNKGEVQKTVTSTSPDGKLTMTVPKGTVALDKDKKTAKDSGGKNARNSAPTAD